MFTYARHSIRSATKDERGQTLALAAVSLVAVFAVGALAVDLGMAFAARAAAQRAADSAALAGASAFIDYSFSTHREAAVDTAEARAYEYALSNDVLGRRINESQVTVWVIPDTQKVRVRIDAAGLPTWFARALGVFSMDVAAQAAAMASDAGFTNKCVLPFAMPDLWHDMNDDTNEDRIPNGDEDWKFDSEDLYLKFIPQDQIPDSLTMSYQWYGTPIDGTGLGSRWRDGQPHGSTIKNDVGRRIWIKQGPPGQGLDTSGDEDGSGTGGMDDMIGPGNFLIWQMPDPEQDCQGRPGATWVIDNIKGCNPCEVALDLNYKTQTGNIASITQAFQEVIAEDEFAEWSFSANDGKGGIINSRFPEGQSPRIRIVPLWDPGLSMRGNSPVRFNNFAEIFLEGGSEPPDFPIYARFLGPARGGLDGPTTGTLVKYLRLVE